MQLVIQLPFHSIPSYSEIVQGLAAGYLQYHLSLLHIGSEREMEKQNALISTTISKSCQWALKPPVAMQDFLWRTYLERGVILSHFYGDCVWHLVTIVFHRDHRVIDKTGAVSQVPRCCQNQEPIARKGVGRERRPLCLLLLLETGFHYTQPWLSWDSEVQRQMPLHPAGFFVKSDSYKIIHTI